MSSEPFFLNSRREPDIPSERNSPCFQEDILRTVCVFSRRIRENSDVFHGEAPNSHESGYREAQYRDPAK